MGKYINDDDLVLVKNRNNGGTGYMLPERHLQRDFAPEQEKKVAFNELAELMYTPGGEYILRHLLIVKDKNARLELGLDVEPEYEYTEEDIRKVMFNGSLDEFTDFVNFAPDGALEIAKRIAVKEFLPDTNKRKILGKRMNFNIDKAIEIESTINTEETKEETDQLEKVGSTTRLATKPAEVKPARKVTPPAHKVVSTAE